ncbi:MAG TPA: CopG family transcriptional regulator [Candidatus Bathyarchaeia archaeon]|nr:CopG family transcriptional regulator [Candidatus Bathyarchaeia archaeon]
MKSKGTKAGRDYITLSIPKELYDRAHKQIDGTGFRSVTEYVVFLLRESLMLKAGEQVKERLRALGYID